MVTDTSALPASIRIYDGEEPHPDLDYAYIDATANDTARNLYGPVWCSEVDYQPGDMTSYKLVFMPLRTLRHARPREWESGAISTAHAVVGMKADGARDDEHGSEGYYDEHGYLVAWLNHGCYPFRLGGGGWVIDAMYVADSLGCNVPLVSGVSIALLLRAVGYHLDLLGDSPALKAVS